MRTILVRGIKFLLIFSWDLMTKRRKEFRISQDVISFNGKYSEDVRAETVVKIHTEQKQCSCSQHLSIVTDELMCVSLNVLSEASTNIAINRTFTS